MARLRASLEGKRRPAAQDDGRRSEEKPPARARPRRTAWHLEEQSASTETLGFGFELVARAAEGQGSSEDSLGNVSTTLASELRVDRTAAAEWYARNRSRSRALFDLIDPAAYYTRPIALRNPDRLLRRAPPGVQHHLVPESRTWARGVDPALEQLFARGIDPESEDNAVPRSGASTRLAGARGGAGVRGDGRRAVIDAIPARAVRRDPPAMRRAKALYTALEHEAMHQETLLYMWHRLPHEQKRRVRRICATKRRGDASAAREAVTVPAGTATLGAARGEIPFGWDNEFDAHSIDVTGVRRRRAQRDQRRLSAVRRGRGTSSRRRSGFATGWRSWFWRGMFEFDSAAAVLARLRQPGRRGGFARGKGRRLMTEAEYHRACVARACDPGARDRCTRHSTSRCGNRCLRARVRGRQPLGRARSRRQRVGMDVHGLRAVSRVRADGVVSGVLRRLLRRPALRHEGRVPGHGEGADPPELPQLVPAELSLCLREVPDRRRCVKLDRMRSRSREFAADVRRDLALTPKQLQSKYLYDALGSSLFEAICRLPWYRITRAESRLLRRHADAIVGRALRRRRSSSSDAAAARSSPCSPRRCRRAAAPRAST